MSQKFNNLVDLWDKSCDRFAARELFGTKTPRGWRWITYSDFKRRVDHFRSGLASLGLSAGDRIAIISNNRVEWAIAAYATYGLGATFVPMYEAMTVDDWEFILADCDAKLVITPAGKIYDQVTALKSKLSKLEFVVGMDLPSGNEHSFARLLETGSAKPVPAVHPKPEDPAGFIYTSGTTGKPKGAILSHKNICQNVNALHELFPLDADRSLAFLPWAHSFGQTIEVHFFISLGCAVGINDEIPNLLANMTEVKPSVLVAVPRIFNRIYDGVNKQMADKPKPIQQLFHSAIAAATKRQRGEMLTMLDELALASADKLIFGKIRDKMGGRLKYAVSGSAALSREVAEFVDALGIEVYEGYGLTEASPVVTTNYPGNRKLGSVGKPIPGVRVEIDKTVTADAQNGEIVVYGDNIMLGYHNREEENRQMLSEDHALRTGDMGRIDNDGYLYITGRIKEQYKLENGKYVVPSPLEEILKLSPFISNVMLYGDNRPHNVALVVVDEPALKRWASEQGKQLGDLTRDPEVKRLIQQELEKHGKELRGYERPRACAVITEDFTVENGLLTPSLKLRRKQALDKYGATLIALYDKP